MNDRGWRRRTRLRKQRSRLSRGTCKKRKRRPMKKMTISKIKHKPSEREEMGGTRTFFEDKRATCSFLFLKKRRAAEKIKQKKRHEIQKRSNQNRKTYSSSRLIKRYRETTKHIHPAKARTIKKRHILLFLF